MEILLTIILLVFGILQIILFFKIWGMTNDIRDVKNKYLSQKYIPTETEYINKQKEDVGIELFNHKTGWADGVTNMEKNEAAELAKELKSDSVIAYVHSKKKMEVWSSEFWNKEKNNPDYKLIFTSRKFQIGDLVVIKKNEDQFRIGEINDENGVVYYSSGNINKAGKYTEEEIELFDIYWKK